MEKLFSNRDLRRMIIPASVESLLDYTIGIADSAMVSFAGDAAVSGITLVNNINSVFIGLLGAFASGGMIISSQFLGAKNQKSANLTAKHTIWLSMLFGLGLMGLLLLFREPLFALLFGTVEAAVKTSALEYLIMTALALPFFGVFKASAAIFRSLGDSRQVMVVSILSNLLNLAGNFVFVRYLGMGALGVGLATLLSRIFSAVLLTVLLVYKKRLISIERLWNPEFNWGNVRCIIKTATPQGVESSLVHLAKVLVMRLVATFSTASIAAYGTFVTVCNLLIVIPDGISRTLTPVVGRCMGAQDPEQAEYYTRKLIKLSYLTNLIVCTVFYFCMDFIFGLYSLTPEAISIAKEMSTLHIVFMVLIHPISYILCNTLQGAGDLKFWAGVCLFSSCVVRVIGAYAINYFFPGCGVMCVRYATYIDWIIRGVAWATRYKWGPWREMRLVKSGS